MSADFSKICLFNFAINSIFILFCVIKSAHSSYGDKSESFRNCNRWCNVNNCSNSTSLAQFSAAQPWYLSFLSWDCWDECEYACMWHAVKVFQFNGQPVPQFHGKWPFRRFFGIQEPASALFSLLNGLAHFLMWQKFRRSTTHLSYSNIWNLQALLSINAWIWSVVFHTRDTPVTEKLDYFCAFSLVLYSFYCLLMRLFAKENPRLMIAIAVPFLAFFIYHIHYLSFIRFDYGYNMQANIIVGLLNSSGWLLWCYKYRQKHYVWKCAISVAAVNLLLLLELGDFPPWRFLIDAHALWHMGTIPVPFLWYSFLIEDCQHEMRNRKLL